MTPTVDIAVDLEGLADRLGGASQLFRDLLAYDADLALVVAVDGREVAAFGKIEVAGLEVVLVGGIDARLRQLPMVHGNVGIDVLGRRRRGDVLFRPDVLDVAVGHVAAAIGESGDDVAAERLDAFRDLLVRAVADAYEHDDRCDADDKAQHGEGRAELVAHDVQKRLAQHLDELHRRTSFSSCIWPSEMATLRLVLLARSGLWVMNTIV